MTQPTDSGKAVKKPWGSYEVIYEGPEKVIKIITVDPGQALSLQSHEHRSEHWFVLEGHATVVLDGETRVLAANETIVIPCGSKHRLLNAGRAMLRVAGSSGVRSSMRTTSCDIRIATAASSAPRLRPDLRSTHR